MGFFKDFATSGSGDITMGVLQGLDNVAKRDRVVNAGVAETSLNKYNKEFDATELAFNNRDQIVNIMANNPSAFGLTAQGDLSIKQVADATIGKIFKEQRSIFENTDFNKVQKAVAYRLAGAGSKGITINDPYVPSSDLFEVEKKKHAARLSAISKMPNADKLLMNIDKAEGGISEAEAITDLQIQGATITAKSFGILNVYPDSLAGKQLLNIEKIGIINDNALRQYPNDEVARANFVKKKMFENKISAESSLSFSKPMTYSLISNTFNTILQTESAQLTQINNAIASAKGDKEKLKELKIRKDNIMYNITSTLDQVSMQSTEALITTPPVDAKKPDAEEKEVKKLIAPENYVPTINSSGQVTLSNGKKMLITDIIANYGVNKKVLSDETIKFVEPFLQFFKADGIMIEPTRDMFPEGNKGDRLFSRLNAMYNNLYPEMDMATLGGMGFIDSSTYKYPTDRRKRSFIEAEDITKKEKSSTLKGTDKREYYRERDRKKFMLKKIKADQKEENKKLDISK
tara:strand:- start:1766 stop:3319 length:1554 start_codon:yes stop_codon:yes gene_type:complete